MKIIISEYNLNMKKKKNFEISSRWWYWSLKENPKSSYSFSCNFTRETIYAIIITMRDSKQIMNVRVKLRLNQNAIWNTSFKIFSYDKEFKR